MAAWIREASDYEPERSEPVGEVIRRWATRSGVAKTSDRDRVWAAWQALLGPEAAHTRLDGLRNYVAYVTVDSSALLSELKNFRKQDLLEGLRREVRAYFVRDIKFRLEKTGPPSGGKC